MNEVYLSDINKFTVRLDTNTDLKDNEVALVDGWYESGFPPEELPNWLIENSDIYAKDVINFVPEDIQKRNRLTAKIDKFQRPFVTAVGILCIVAILL